MTSDLDLRNQDLCVYTKVLTYLANSARTMARAGQRRVGGLEGGRGYLAPQHEHQARRGRKGGLVAGRQVLGGDG